MHIFYNVITLSVFFTFDIKDCYLVKLYNFVIQKKFITIIIDLKSILLMYYIIRLSDNDIMKVLDLVMSIVSQ